MRHLVVLSVFLTVLVHVSHQQSCEQGVNCIAPACRCMSMNNPGGFSYNETPQLVFLTFNGALTVSQALNYTTILNNRQNPNGCPVTATFFASHEYNDYNLTNYLFNRGHEIASFTMTSSYDSVDTWKNKTAPEWNDEIGGMKTAIAKYANIPTTNIRGFRAPYLQTSGNATLQAVKDLGMLYDASFPTPESGSTIWPYTMDFGLQHGCSIDPCPKNGAQGVWTVPINTLTVDSQQYAMADAYSPTSAADTYNYLLTNFNRHRNDTKAPFGIHLNANRWFGQPETSYRMTGYLQFLDYLKTLPDVYIVSISKGIDWMKNPVNLNAAGATGGPFACQSVPLRSCTPRNCYYDAGSSPIGDRNFKSCVACPDVYPWVGNPNGIL